MLRIIIYTIVGSFVGILLSFLTGPIISRVVEYFIGSVGAVQGSMFIILSHIVVFGCLGAFIGAKLKRKSSIL